MIMRRKTTLSTKVTILVLIIILLNTVAVGAFSYMIHRSDTIKSNADRTMAIARSAAMFIEPGEFRRALDTNQKNEHYEALRRQFDTIKSEENLLYFYAGTFDPEAGMTMYVEGHGDMFGLNGEVPLSIFPQAAFDAFESGEARVTDVYRLNIDGSWGISTYAPIFDEDMETIGLVGVLVSLSEALSKSDSFALTMLLISLGIFFVIIWVPIIYLRKAVAKPLLSLQTASGKIARGDMDIHVPVRKGRDEVGALSQNFSTMKEIVVGMHQEIKELVENATNGNLHYRAQPDKYTGEWRHVIEKFNDLMDTIMLPIDEAADTLHNIAGGDFSARIASEYRGDFDRIKKAVNSAAINLDRYLTEKEKAESALFRAEQQANRAKSEFLSRMSHEMRTPMNAIIGMTKIAKTTGDVSRLKYCIDTISASSSHLLEIINDVLDMSKIEAGKFELENVPMNIEKMLMKVCSIVIDNMEKKDLQFNVSLSRDLELNYIADDLRLSQVIINLLSNAMKFTPKGGKIRLSVESVERHGGDSTLRFSVTDSGIGMTDKQIARLFNAFEQADGSVSRKYGGTGLGLAISKSIIEKMEGRIWVESVPGAGSTFIFEVCLVRASHQEHNVIGGLHPEDIRVLIVENDEEIRKHFMSILDSFGISADSASDAGEARTMLEAARNLGRTHDVVFLDYDLPGVNGIDFVNEMGSRINKGAVVIITAYLEWQRIEETAQNSNLDRFITKPLFPSSVLDAISESVGWEPEDLDRRAFEVAEAMDLSGVHIILAEDVEINREIFVALLEDTGITIDVAENGLAAVSLFGAYPEKYDLIVMDIQMPVMDGYQATKAIREMELPRAKTIPIIAMTANAFKEDIERCLAGGMDDHLAKPIDEKAVIEKIVYYAQTCKPGK